MHPIVWLEIFVPETARAIPRTSQNSAVDKVVQANRKRAQNIYMFVAVVAPFLLPEDPLGAASRPNRMSRRH